MRNFRLVTDGIDVAPLLSDLDAHPELWGQNPDRGDQSVSPHREMQDIWLRFRARDELNDRSRFWEPHDGVWYPGWHELPSTRPIVFDLMRRLEAVHLGGILITRIPAGKQIYPHHDRGGWHAAFYDTKVYVPLRAPAECINIAEPERVVMRAGEAWWFDNSVVHSVENHSPTEDRISLIVTMRQA